jgi:alpha,alpha-trehalose phosphorylase
MRHEGGTITFDPRLPDGWEELSFPLTVQGSRFRTVLRQQDITFTLEDGGPLDVGVRGQQVTVTASPTVVPLSDQGPRLDSTDLARPVGVGDERADGSIIGSYVPSVDPESPWEIPVDSDEPEIREVTA